MDYFRIYKEIIRKFGTDVKQFNYCERHHIIPRCMGGTDISSNLVYLPARVHFMCHRILCKVYPHEKKLKFAFWAMCNQLTGDIFREYKVTSRTFETAKTEFSLANSLLHKGKKLSSEHIEIIRKRMILMNIHAAGKKSHLFGKKRSEDVKTKISRTKKANPEKNALFKGWYITPQGTFGSAPLAAEMTTYSLSMIREYCKNPDKLITKQMASANPDIPGYAIGLPLRELGWDFLPKQKKSRP